MAQVNYFDPVELGLPVATPAAPGPIPYEPSPLPERRYFSEGLQSGLSGLKSTGYGVLAAGAGAFGFKNAEQAALAAAREHAADAGANAMRVEDLSTVGDYGNFFKYGLGQALPSLGLMAAGSLGGAGIGRLLAKNAIRNATAQFGAEVGRRVGGEAVALGAGVGGMAASTGMEAGSIYPEAVETGVENPLLRTAAGGLAAGALDVLGPMQIMRRFGVLGPAAAGAGILGRGGFAGAAKTAAADVGKLIATEAPTEAAQTYIERLAAGKPTDDAEAISEYVNAAAAAVPMGVLGIPGGAYRGFQGPAQPEAAPQPVAVPAPEAAVQPPLVSPSADAAAVVPPATAVTSPATPAAPEAAPAAPVAPVAPVTAAPTAEPGAPAAPAPTISPVGTRFASREAAEQERSAIAERLVALQDDTALAQQRQELDGRLVALQAERKAPKDQRRSQQEIAADTKRVKAEIAGLGKGRDEEIKALQTRQSEADSVLTLMGDPSQGIEGVAQYQNAIAEREALTARIADIRSTLQSAARLKPEFRAQTGAELRALQQESKDATERLAALDKILAVAPIPTGVPKIDTGAAPAPFVPTQTAMPELPPEPPAPLPPLGPLATPPANRADAVLARRAQREQEIEAAYQQLDAQQRRREARDLRGIIEQGRATRTRQAIRTAQAESEAAAPVEPTPPLEGAMSQALRTAGLAPEPEAAPAPPPPPPAPDKPADLVQRERMYDVWRMLRGGDTVEIESITDEELEQAIRSGPTSVQKRALTELGMRADLERAGLGAPDASNVRADQAVPASQGEVGGGSGADRGGDVQQAPEEGEQAGDTLLRQQDEGVRSEAEVTRPRVLQNRDRSSDAAVSQMQRIAGGPDPLRLSFSRTLDTGAPVIFANGNELNTTSKRLGRHDDIVDASGKVIHVRYALVDAFEVIASHDVDGFVNPGYEQNEAPGALRAINNGRVAGLQEAYRRGTAAKYKEGMIRDASLFGLNADAIRAMKNPMVVRVMSEADVTEDIGDRSNVGQIAQLSPVDQAATDARRIDLNKLDFREDGTPTREAVRAFVARMPEQEQTTLAPNGEPGAIASSRLMNAVFFSAYGPEITNLYVGTDDVAAKTVIRALAIAAKDMVALDGAGDLDARPTVRAAVEVFVAGRRNGVAPSEIAQQVNMGLTPEANNVLGFFARNHTKPRVMGNALAKVARFLRVEADKPPSDMFGNVERFGMVDALRQIDEQDADSVRDSSGTGLAEPSPGRRGSRANRPARTERGGNLPDDRGAGQARSLDLFAGPEDFTLAGQTPEEVRAQAQAQARIQAEARAEQARADAAARTERERREVAQRSQAAADTFELGGDAEQNLTGQRSLFEPGTLSPAHEAAAFDAGEDPHLVDPDTKETPSQWVARLKAERQALERRVLDLFARDEIVVARGRDGRGPPGYRIALTRDASEPGKVRVTRFDDQGPIGHSVFNDPSDAVSEFSGFDIDEAKGKSLNVPRDAGPEDAARLTARTEPLLVEVQTELPSFKRWFKGSKVVYAGDMPLRVYHGTTADFGEVFGTEPDRPGSFSLDGIGAWFAEEPRLSNAVIEHYRERRDGAPKSLPVYLSIKNPLVVQGRRFLESVLLTRGAENTTEQAMSALREKMASDPAAAAKEIKARLIAQGFDGLRILDDTRMGASWVAFSPEQIKSAIGNVGTFDQTDPNILREGPSTFGFRAWAGDRPVVQPEDLLDFDGGPAVFRLYTGTTGDFTTFDRSRANIESDMGAGIYFSNSTEDVSANYAGEGPDLTTRLIRTAERIEQEEEFEGTREEAMALARQQLAVQHGGMVLPVYVRTENPVVIAKDGGTFFDYEEAIDDNGEYTGRETGRLVEFVEELRNVTTDISHGAPPDNAIGAVMMRAAEDGGITASELVRILKADETFSYAEGLETEGMIRDEIIRQTFENLGFDAIVDKTVNDKFGTAKPFGKPMTGMDEDTVHVIAFQANQIKSALGNAGTFDPSNPNILAESGDQLSLDLSGPARIPGATYGTDLLGRETVRLNPTTTEQQAVIDQKLVRFSSGLNAADEIAAGGRAVGAQRGRGLGVEVGQLSQRAIESLAASAVNQDTQLFVDSGAFGVFRKELAGGGVRPLDFAKILGRYDELMTAIQDANPAEERVNPPLLVMPDAVGNQALSLALLEKHKDWIKAEMQGRTSRPIIPIQKGALSLADAYRKAVAILGSDNFIVGIPSNEAAATDIEVAQFMADARPRGVHILGATSDARLGPRLMAIANSGQLDALEHLSADASQIRSNVVQKGQDRAQRLTKVQRYSMDIEAAAKENGVTPEEFLGWLEGRLDAKGRPIRRETTQAGNFELNETAEPKRDPFTLDLFRQPPKPETKAQIVDKLKQPMPQAPVPGAQFATITEPRKTGEIKSGVTAVKHGGDAAHILASLRKSPQERLFVLVLDANRTPVSVLRLSHGGTDYTTAPMDIIAKAVFQTPNAHSIFLAHNHPSGNPEVSDADVDLTRTVTRFFRDTGIEVDGHIVIAGTQYTRLGPMGVSAPPQPIPAYARTNTLPITERTIRKHGRLDEQEYSLNGGEALVRKLLNNKPGVVFLDRQNRPVATMEMSLAEMRQLRNGPGSNAARFFATAGRANASGVVIHLPGIPDSTHFSAASNMVIAAVKGNLRAVDAVVGAVSLNAQRYPFSGTDFYARTALDDADTRNTLRTAIGQEIANYFDRILGGPQDLEVRVFEQRDPEGFAGRFRATPYKDLIEIATNAKTPLSVAAHEGFHRIETKHLNAGERAVLNRGLAKGTALYGQVIEQAQAYDRENGTNIADEIEDNPLEAHAYAFQFWNEGKLEPKGAMAKVFQKIRELLERIRNFIEGYGFQSTEDLFDAVDRGVFAKSERKSFVVDATEAYSRIDLDMQSRGMVGMPETAGPTWFSQLARSVDNIKMNTASGAQWKATIKGLPGVKADEIEWSGLNEWLDAQQGRVTKEQIAEFLRGNGVQVTETMLGEPEAARTPDSITDDERTEARIAFGIRTATWNALSRDEQNSYALEMLESARNRAMSGPQYAAHTLPGGENYRELLLTLPNPRAAKLRALELRRAAGERLSIAESEEYHDLVEASASAGTFESSHFEQPNILAHVRFNERTDADGKRVLFLEEIQSDWAQGGKRRGFREDQERRLSELVARRAASTVPVEQTRLQEEISALVNREPGVPSAPFVGKTEAWVALALKRMIRYAAENGFDRVAWTTGAQQADRYDLSKQIDVLAVKRVSGGTSHPDFDSRLAGAEPETTPLIVQVSAQRGGEPVLTKEVDARELPDVIGKDMAARALKDIEEGRRAFYRGIDLKVGGEGMKAFYDKIVPNVARDVAKKLGGGKVGTIGIALNVPTTTAGMTRIVRDDDGTYAIEVRKYDENDESYWEVAAFGLTKEQAESRRLFGGQIPQMQQPGFDITPQMREKAMQGMPLFSRSAIKSVDANIRRGKEAMNRALLNRADVNRAMFRSGLGWVDFVWGDAKRGLAHIFARRAERDDMDNAAVERMLLDQIVPAIAKGREIRRHEVAGSLRAVIENGDHQAVLVRNRGSNTWLLAAWERSGPGARTEANDTAPATQRTADSSDDAQGAGPNGTIPQAPLFSRAAIRQPGQPDARQAMIAESLKDLIRKSQAGEIPYTELMAQMGKIANVASPPAKKKLFGNAALNTWGDLSRAYTTHIASGHNLAKMSSGFRNAFQVLTSYTQRKNRLIADNLEVRLSEWVSLKTEVSQADLNAASAVLMERTSRRLEKDSPELGQLLAPLTAKQRSLYKQATETMERMLWDEFEADRRDFARTFERNPEEFATWERNRKAQIDDLVRFGYVPERRYGDHGAHVYLDGKDKAGNPKRITLYYSLHERESDARDVVAGLERELKGNPELKVEYGYRYSPSFDGSLSFKQFIDLAEANDVSLTQKERERLAKAFITADSARRLRIFQRKNVPGFSEDGRRVLAEFVVNVSNRVAYSEFGDAVKAALRGHEVTVTVENGAPKITMAEKAEMWSEDENAGYYRMLAERTAQFAMGPQEQSPWSRNLRMIAGLQFLGGSMATAVVQLSSLPMNVVPNLFKYTGYGNAWSKTMGAAQTTFAHFKTLRDLVKLKDAQTTIPGIDAELKAALARAGEDGTTLDTELYQLMGLTRGGVFAKNRQVQRAIEVWMTPFRWSEQANRIATFIAGYRIGKENGLSGDKLYEFAQTLVYDTQFRYDEANRPAITRSPTWAVLFTFKSYPIFMAEMIYMLFKEKPQAGVAMLAGLTLAAGTNGIPFAEDLMDLVDTIAQRVFGKPFNSERAMRNLLKSASEAAVGADWSNVMMNGAANELLGLSIASRVGLGNLLPGTRTFAVDADTESQLKEMFGPVGSMFYNWSRGIGAGLQGDVLEFARTGAPGAIQNIIKGVEQGVSGYAQDAKGRKIVDVNGWQAFWQAMGFSSSTLSEAYDLDRIDKQSTAFYNHMRQQFMQQIVGAIRDGEREKIQETVDAIKAWNESNPDMPIRLNPASIRRNLMQAQLPINQRTLQMLPKPLRAGSIARETIMETEQ